MTTPKSLRKKIFLGLGAILVVTFLFVSSPAGRSLFDKSRNNTYQPNGEIPEESAPSPAESSETNTSVQRNGDGSLSFEGFEEYKNSTYGYLLSYDAVEFKLISVGDIVFVRGDDPKYEIIISPVTYSGTFDELSDFVIANNDGGRRMDGWRGAERVVSFSGYDAIEFPEEKVYLDYPSDFFIAEHEGKIIQIQTPFLGNETWDTLSFF